MTQEDTEFWSSIVKRVTTDLAKGLPVIERHLSLASKDVRNWERPIASAITIPAYVTSRFDCQMCGEHFLTFDTLLYHSLDVHGKFGHSLMDDLKNGHSVRHIR